MKRPSLFLECALFVGLCGIPALRAQAPPPPVRVQVHVGAEDAARWSMLACLDRDLRAVQGVEVVDRDPDYLLSVVLVPTPERGLVAGVTAMNLYTEVAIENLTRSWGASEDVRRRARATFRGAGALVDQRVVTGADIEPVCHDIARAFSADTLFAAGRVR